MNKKVDSLKNPLRSGCRFRILFPGRPAASLIADCFPSRLYASRWSGDTLTGIGR